MKKLEVLRVSNKIFEKIGIRNITGFTTYDLGWDVNGYQSFEYDGLEKWVNSVSKVVKVMDDLKINFTDKRINHKSHNETILS
jgi:hypothetical protein